LRGILILIGIIALSVFFCGVVPFMIMRPLGAGVALPVITVPGEVVWEDFLGVDGLEVTNTVIGTLITDVVVLLFAFLAVRNLKEVPGRLQGLFEVLTDALYGVTKATAGVNARRILPLMATIFLFLLAANWIKLVPGAESIGLMHCAHEGINGYEKNGAVLEIDTDELFDKGTVATHHDYEACKYGHSRAYDYAHEALGVALAAELDLDVEDGWEHFEHGDIPADYIAAQQAAAVEAEEADAEESAAAVETVAEAAHERLLANVEADLEAGTLTGEEAEAIREEGDHLIEEQLHEPKVRDDIYAVTPFVRGAATDLNLTLGLGLLAMVAVQVFGVQALGAEYFAKFINTPALGKLDKEPMGAMDFIVGLLETISEFAKILSFGFRLFGNIFAGGVLLIIISFLMPMLLPAGVYGLELFIGAIQAFVFAMLFMVFASIAMQGHGHDDEHH
jgi:F-type H+-transporting ATPase subunit a